MGVTIGKAGKTLVMHYETSMMSQEKTLKGVSKKCFPWTSLTAHAVVSRFAGYKSKIFSYK